MAMTSIPQGRSQSLPTAALLNNASSRRQSAFQSFGLRRKSEVDIVIDGGEDFIHTYSTFDEIKGHVNVRFEKDTPIDDFHIWLQGETNTWVARMAGPSPRTGRATAKHVFLKIQQPIGATPFSENNIAKAGVHYQIPFKFIVPDRLLPFICSHKVDHDDVKDQHLLLPPSIGDAMIAGEGQVLMDDLAPAMSKIVYTVRARLAKATLKGRQLDVITESVGVRIVPSRDELPPASVADGPGECFKFQLRTEKNVRKGILGIGKKQGRLTAETTQPRSLMLRNPSKPTVAPATTMTTVHLRYDPASMNEQPPQLSSFSTKLKVFTFFGAGPFKNLPAPNKYDVWSIMHGIYPETVSLSSMNLTSVNWDKHEMDGGVVSSTGLRRSSTATTNSSNKKAVHQAEPIPNPSSRPEGPARHPSTFSDTSDISSATYSSEASTTASSPTSSSVQPNLSSTTISPSTTYNPSLPYYTTSILIPITLPSYSSSSDQQISSTPVIISTPTSSTTLPIKQKSRITFLPTFHSCLISRTYALEISLSTQGTTAPSLNLRTPIQLAIDPTPTSPLTTTTATNLYPSSSSPSPILRTNTQASLPAPIEFYDPFSLPSNIQTDPSHLPDYADGEYRDYDADSKATDEAIARALDSPSPQNYNHTSNHNQISSTPISTTNPNNNMEQIPEYSELQIQSFTSVPPLPPPPSPSSLTSTTTTRRTSTTPNPITNTSNIPTNTRTQVQASAAQENEESPPEYYSSFRRASTLMALGMNRSTRLNARAGPGNESTTSTSTTTGSGAGNDAGGANGASTSTDPTPAANARERRGSRKWSFRS